MFPNSAKHLAFLFWPDATEAMPRITIASRKLLHSAKALRLWSSCPPTRTLRLAWRLLVASGQKGRQDAGAVGNIAMQTRIGEQGAQARGIEVGHLLVVVEQAEIAKQAE